MTEQEIAFWETVVVFEKEGLLPYVMLIGSWAEYIYENFLYTEFKANLKTRDVDYFYRNLRKPLNQRINISDSLKEKGFIYTENRLDGVGKFIKEDLLELEFLTRVLGQGQPINEIPSLKIKAVGMREVNMLAEYPLAIDCNGYNITVPEPEAYMIHKLIINSKRTPEKMEKDIRAMRELIRFADKERLREISLKMSRKEQALIEKTKSVHFIEF